MTNASYHLKDKLNLQAVLSIQDEDFVLDKDDGGSPTDDSGEGESDASVSGDEKEVMIFLILLVIC